MKKRPLYIILRQYRVLQVVLTAFLAYITYGFSIWIMAAPFITLNEWHLAVIVAAYPALIAGLFALVNTISKKNESDDYDDFDDKKE